MPFVVKMQLTGLEPLLRRLKEIDRKVAKQATRKAVDQAGKIVLDAAKSRVPQDTGLLKKSLGSKVKVFRGSGAVVAIVGPRTGFKVTSVAMRTALTATKSGRVRGGTATAMTAAGINRKTGKMRKPRAVILRTTGTRSGVGSNPTRYAAQVERGRKGEVAKGRAMVVQGIGFRKRVGPAKAKPFMGPALDSSKGKVVAVMTTVLQAALTGA